MSLTPRSTDLHQQIDDYIAGAAVIARDSLAAARASTAFADVYHISLSADAVLRGFAGPRLRPRPVTARSIVLRVPLLVGIGQRSVAMLELRRFVELMCWTVYFSDHPVEWRSFATERGRGFSRDKGKPISFAAHQELGHYVEYARELMHSEPSGLGLQAVDCIKQVTHELNASVHAGQMAHAVGMKAPHEDISELGLKTFAAVQRRAFSNCCIVLSAYLRPQFDRLNAVSRAHFDWLVGAKVRRQVRQGPFGLPDT